VRENIVKSVVAICAALVTVVVPLVAATQQPGAQTARIAQVPALPPATPPLQPPSQAADAARASAVPPAAPPSAPSGLPLPAGYVIGPEDVLLVLFWRDKDMSTEVAVRPDGRITLPLINEVQAAGLTPEQLRDQVMTAAAKYVVDPNVSVVVKAINSRKVFITGAVGKPGAYPLTAPTTVMQLIALAGGLQEFADAKHIIVMRTDNGHQMAVPFNYKDVLKRKNLKQNIALRPGDTVVVP
jgi:polysaccharide biosynthesis/export protein